MEQEKRVRQNARLGALTSRKRIGFVQICKRPVPKIGFLGRNFRYVTESIFWLLERRYGAWLGEQPQWTVTV